MELSTMTKIGKVTVPVTYRRPGNIKEQIMVEFEVYQEGQNYQVLPSLSEVNKRIINLPKSVSFQVKEGKVFNTKYKYLAIDILNILKEKNLIQNTADHPRQ